MPCRSAHLGKVLNPVATAPYLWITDDVLADAYQRYARHSFAHRHHARRGSNVPGPLEAQRRLARRRMGMVTVDTSAHPMPILECSNWFGHGIYPGQKDTRFSFDWLPPTPLGPPHKSNASDKQDDSWSRFLQLTEEVEHKEPGQYADSTTSRAYESQQKFLELLESRPRHEHVLQDGSEQDVVQRSHISDLLEFLQTSLDEPEAENSSRLAQWLTSNNASREAWLALAAVVLSKLELGTLRHPAASQIVASMIASVHRDDLADAVSSIVKTLSKDDRFSGSIILITHLIGSQMKSKERRDAEIPAAYNTWLDVLAQSRHGGATVPTDQVYLQISRYATSPADFAAHLSRETPGSLAWILLRSWIYQKTRRSAPKRQMRPRTHFSRNSEDGVEKIITLHLPQNRSAHGEIMRQFRDTYNSWDSKVTVLRPNPLVGLLALIKQHGISHLHLSHQILTILAESRSPAVLKGLFDGMYTCSTLGVTASLGSQFIRHFLAMDQPRLAFDVFSKVPEISLLDCHELPLVLVRAGFSSARIMEMLSRQTNVDKLSLRQRKELKLSLLPEHISLVHLMADAFAAHPKINSRVAFRRVWECYRFLRDRRAPVGNLITRALVTAGIARPQAERRSISRDQVDYVLGLVGRVEGEEVERTLRRMVKNFFDRDAVPRHALQHRRSSETSLDIMSERHSEADADIREWTMRVWAKSRAGKTKMWFRDLTQDEERARFARTHLDYSSAALQEPSYQGPLQQAIPAPRTSGGAPVSALEDVSSSPKELGTPLEAQSVFPALDACDNRGLTSEPEDRLSENDLSDDVQNHTQERLECDDAFEQRFLAKGDDMVHDDLADIRETHLGPEGNKTHPQGQTQADLDNDAITSVERVQNKNIAPNLPIEDERSVLSCLRERPQDITRSHKKTRAPNVDLTRRLNVPDGRKKLIKGATIVPDAFDPNRQTFTQSDINEDMQTDLGREPDRDQDTQDSDSATLLDCRIRKIGRTSNRVNPSDLISFALEANGLSHAMPFQPAQPSRLRSEFVSAGDHFVQRIIAKAIPPLTKDSGVTSLPYTSSEHNFIHSSGYNETHIRAWVTAIAAQDSRDALEVLTRHVASHGINSVPLLVFNYILRRPSISAQALRLAIQYAQHWLNESTASDRISGLDKHPMTLISIRLIRHAREVWPQALAPVVDLVLHHWKCQEKRRPILTASELRASTHFLNKLLRLISLPTKEGPFRNIDYQEDAIIRVLRYMSEHEPAMHINREGYRSVAHVQMAQRKTSREQEWAYLKALSWPPWKSDRTGMDADIGPEHGISRAGETLRQMRAAGYDWTIEENVVSVYAGWDTDRTPTIQTRSLRNQKPRSSGSGSLWAARIATTRTAQEAWACYLAWCDRKHAPDGDVYRAIFEKLHAEQARLRKAEANHLELPLLRPTWELYSGDQREVEALPPSTHLYTYTRTPPPTLDALAADLRKNGVTLEGDALAFLVSKSGTLSDGLLYLQHNLPTGLTLEALFSPGQSQTSDVVPDSVFTAIITLLMRFGFVNLEAALPAVSPIPAHLLNPASISEDIIIPHASCLARALALLRAKSTTCLPAWHTALSSIQYYAIETGNGFGSWVAKILRAQSGHWARPTHNHVEKVFAHRLFRCVLAMMQERKLENNVVVFESHCQSVASMVYSARSILVEATSQHDLPKFGPSQDPKGCCLRLLSPETAAGLREEFRAVFGPHGETPKLLTPTTEDTMVSYSPLSSTPVDDLLRENGAEQEPIERKPARLVLGLPRLTKVPTPNSLHAYVRALGWLGDDAGILALLHWLAEYRDEVAEEQKLHRLGGSMMRKALIAVRVFLERQWILELEERELNKSDRNEMLAAGRGEKRPAGNEQAREQRGSARARQADASQAARTEHALSGDDVVKTLERLEMPADESVLMDARDIVDALEEWGGWATDEETSMYCSRMTMKE